MMLGQLYQRIVSLRVCSWDAAAPWARQRRRRRWSLRFLGLRRWNLINRPSLPCDKLRVESYTRTRDLLTCKMTWENIICLFVCSDGIKILDGGFWNTQSGILWYALHRLRLLIFSPNLKISGMLPMCLFQVQTNKWARANPFSPIFFSGANFFPRHEECNKGSLALSLQWFSYRTEFRAIKGFNQEKLTIWKSAGEKNGFYQ